jgi:hypothetical protein
MASTIRSLTFDCADPIPLAHFWAAVLGYEFLRGAEDGAIIVDPDGTRPRLLFLVVPEGKTAKNRVHFDLTPDDTMDAEVERLVGLGAKKIEAFYKENDVFTVMQDPEGNEFCVERGPGDMQG